jgi:hypothetical protein
MPLLLLVAEVVEHTLPAAFAVPRAVWQASH